MLEDFQPQTLRRPEALRWAVLAAIVVVFVFSVAFAAKAGADSPIAAALNIGIALALIWFARELWRTRARSLTFDGAKLYDDAGEVICALEEIEAVERGFALFKPSNGFALLLKARKTRAWSPGLWWRVGRRVGVGGATPGKGARNMADAITMVIALKEKGLDGGDQDV